MTLPPGVDYDFRRYTLRGDTTTRRAVAFTTNLSFGSFFSGHRRGLGGSISLRPRRGILLQLNANFNRVELLEGGFSTRLLRTTINTQFSPFVSVSNTSSTTR